MIEDARRVELIDGLPVAKGPRNRPHFIVNLVDGLVEVYGDPDPSHGYRSRLDFRHGDSIPVALDGHEIGRAAVADLLPDGE